MKKIIFLDNASTTKVFDEVDLIVSNTNRQEYFNPSGLYSYSNVINNKINMARENILKSVNAHDYDFIFTSSATEANNWSIFKGIKNKKGKVFFSLGEHASVYEVMQEIKNQGLNTIFLPLNSTGVIDEQSFYDLIDGSVSFVSIIHASNETGAINDVLNLAKYVKQVNPKSIVHVDGVQAFCKIDVNLGGSCIDLYTISGHKLGAPKGIGGLFIKKSLNIQPLILGGGQEKKMRSGTENTSAILGLEKAIKINLEAQVNKLHQNYKQYLMDCLLKNLDNIIINGLSQDSLPNILSVSIKGIKSEILQRLLAEDNILIGLGSACSSKSSKNRVLSAIGLENSYIEGNIRLSFGYDTTFEDVRFACEKIIEKVTYLRGQI